MKPKRNYKPGTIDNCQTPGYAFDPLLDIIPKNFIIWECASGEGYLARAMIEEGYQVISTDIDEGNDFFICEPSLYDCIVTNPPYSLKIDWIERCYELGYPWALLLPVETIGTQKAQKLFKTHNPGIGIIYVDKRINFKMPYKGWDGKGAQFPTAWYTWNLGFEGIKYYDLYR